MDLQSLVNEKGARHRVKRYGCGESSGHGKTSGRGGKGQMARKGSSHKPGFEGGQMKLIRRIPKRGFKNPVRRTFLAVNVGSLDRFADGTAVTPALLKSSGVVGSGAWSGVKVLGGGELHKKLAITAHAFSAAARAKIEAAGGTCETAVV